MGDDGVVQVWRASTGRRVVYLLVLVGLPFLLVLPMVSTRPALAAGVAVGEAAVGLAVWWLVIGRPRLELHPTTLVVVNPFGTREIPLESVVHARPGWGGLRISGADAPLSTAWAVQKSNYATVTGRPTRGDEIADAVVRAAAERRAELGIISPNDGGRGIGARRQGQPGRPRHRS